MLVMLWMLLLASTISGMQVLGVVDSVGIVICVAGRLIVLTTNNATSPATSCIVVATFLCVLLAGRSEAYKFRRVPVSRPQSEERACLDTGLGTP